MLFTIPASVGGRPAGFPLWPFFMCRRLSSDFGLYGMAFLFFKLKQPKEFNKERTITGGEFDVCFPALGEGVDGEMAFRQQPQPRPSLRLEMVVKETKHIEPGRPEILVKPRRQRLRLRFRNPLRMIPNLCFHIRFS